MQIYFGAYRSNINVKKSAYLSRTIKVPENQKVIDTGLCGNEFSMSISTKKLA